LISLGLLINFVIADPLSTLLALIALAITWPMYRHTQRQLPNQVDVR
jgi:hypothetical protein